MGFQRIATRDCPSSHVSNSAGIRVKTWKTFRPINAINLNTLNDDLANSDLLIQPKATLCELVNQCHEHKVNYWINIPQNKKRVQDKIARM